MSALDFNTTICYERIQSSPDEPFTGSFNGVDLTFCLTEDQTLKVFEGTVARGVVTQVTSVRYRRG